MAKANRQASKRIDKFIKEAPTFARPICKRLRDIIHKTDPEIIEDWKWGPNFNKKGMVCGFGAFKNHVSLAFFKGALMKDPRGILIYGTSNRLTRAVQFTSEYDLDEDTLIEYIREAVLINEKGIKSPPPTKVISIPEDLLNALNRNHAAKENFINLAYTYRKEYVDWVESARRPKTRENRITEVVRRASLNQKQTE